MKLTIEGLGPIKKAITLEPRRLTVLAGANNTGKTYALYLLNALLDSRLSAHHAEAKHIAHALVAEKECVLELKSLITPAKLKQAGDDFSKALQAVLPRFFAAENDFGASAKFHVELDASEILTAARAYSRATGADGFWAAETVAWRNAEGGFAQTGFEVWLQNDALHFVLRGDSSGLAAAQRAIETTISSWLSDFYLPDRSGRDFLLPAERSGVNLFFRELNSRRAALLRHVTSQTLDTAELLKDIIVSRYPQPIQDYIEFLSSQPEIKRNKSDFADLADELQKNVLQVKYKIDRNGDISIVPAKSGTTSLGLHLGSSTVKTFFGLWSYLNHAARVGDWLMIDEPELNLHPRNQLLIAQLLAKAAKRGIRVVVSTHSDYMVRMWGNLVMLGSHSAVADLAPIAQSSDLSTEAFLTTYDVAAFEFDQGGCTRLPVTDTQGIGTVLFDRSIDQLNKATQDIYFSIQESLENPASVMNEQE